LSGGASAVVLHAAGADGGFVAVAVGVAEAEDDGAGGVVA
jgi:hypothetical protein